MSEMDKVHVFFIAWLGLFLDLSAPYLHPVRRQGWVCLTQPWDKDKELR